MAVSEELRSAYAPTGELRVALNHGNRVLIGRDEGGHPVGITAELAAMLADELGLPYRFVDYERAGDVSGLATQDAWDVCFLAVDPDRATVIDFTQPYIRIEGCYLASEAAAAVTASEVVKNGLRVGAVKGSAYTLHLARAAGAEKLVQFPDFRTAMSEFDRGQIDVIAGVRQAMAAEAALRPGSRLLEPPFMEILQAMGLPAGRDPAIGHLRNFLAEKSRGGIIGDLLARNGVARECAL
ncbi:transporter substrate-binding domain-containing protein [Pseudorhizobium pelagicum]|uniref:Solute-binding protein family 3/N-terminal domain-containing protein n=1 Tax=Pseudorhizobium pelagicum TaxID=1509405 RepID=A0A922P4K9_9HYPH|nr:transporter substrate-binding domain-containing protein [Pseudorhizobium pelagicum]KEQ08310.1 hypothetical protein GV68_03260 [Pseudorhizobium pelagicum]KEQ09152.1 hypothetical protein GV67_00295 [Pseudorhizobium pelagicum]